MAIFERFMYDFLLLFHRNLVLVSILHHYTEILPLITS